MFEDDVIDNEDSKELNEATDDDVKDSEDDVEKSSENENQEQNIETEEEGGNKTYTQAELERVLNKKRRQIARKMERETEVKLRDIEEKALREIESYKEQLAAQYIQQVPGQENVINQQSPYHPSNDIAKKVEEKLAEREQQARIAREEAQIDELREKHEDFDDVISDLRYDRVVTPQMLKNLTEDFDNAPDFLYRAGKSFQEDLRRISMLPPKKQRKELIKLEDKVYAKPPSRKVTHAPPPPKKINSSGSAAAINDVVKADFNQRVQMLLDRRKR